MGATTSFEPTPNSERARSVFDMLAAHPCTWNVMSTEIGVTLCNRILPDLAGCVDVDIAITPATNTLPIKRLRLQAQESKDILAAYVPLPNQVGADFLPRPAEQRYTCLTPGRLYRYDGLVRGFTAELEIDEAGLVLDYPGMFRRLALIR